ncbi:MAG: hypothetical protein MJA32_00460 [Proteobacteria bacterium]|nr:hypothetical protein [Pseudomonadota bacterium]
MNEKEFIATLMQVRGDAHEGWLRVPFDELPIDSLDLLTFAVLLERSCPDAILKTKFAPQTTLRDLYEAVR